ncbi:MAG: hypothetical protein KGD63_14400 [Candidatus Lokiarchaeota archaeon]|nr:hypothetical protein [Candidatus Lokiarchaeota archaeon]
MANIYIDYNISNQKSIYQPGDIISGTFSLKNRGNQDEKLKKVIIKYVEYFYSRERVIIKRVWNPIIKTLKETVVDKGRIIKANEKLEYRFKFKLPISWKNRKSPKIKDWKISLCFFEKTGLISTTGIDGNGVYEVPISQ